MKKITLLFLTVLAGTSAFAVTPGGPPLYAPIDTYQIVLVIMAIALMSAFAMYKRAKKA